MSLLSIILSAISGHSFGADQLDSISVTATREAQKTLEVPASVGVIERSVIELDQPHYQKELFNSIAGVRVTQTGSSLGHMTAIRMPLNTSPYYLFLQDGIPVQSSGFFNHNGLAYTNFTSAGSTEVLKGAGTALYGSDAIAATINVLSNDPSLTNTHELKANAGSDGFYQIGAVGGFSQHNNSSLGYEFSISENDGWRDHTASERDELGLTHFTTLDDSNTLKTVVTANRTEAEMAGSLIGLDELENNTTSVGDVEAALNSGLEIKRKFDFARISTEWTRFIGEDMEISTIGYVRSNRNRYVATWEPNLPQNDSQQDSVGVMFKLDLDRGDTRWIFGTDVERTEASRRYRQLFDFTPSGFGSPVPAGDIYNYDVDYLALSPYLRAEVDLAEKWQLGAGLRYDHNEFDYTNNLSDGQYATSTYSRPGDNNDPSFDHFSPKLSLSYRIDGRQSAYARYANGFRIPQATRLYSLRISNIAFTLEPETTDTIEFGYKLRGERHDFETALYLMTIDDSIVERDNANGESFYVNAGKTEHQGVELSWVNRISDSFKTRIAYSYSKHNYVDDPEFGNNEQAEAPNNTANLRFIFSPQSVTGLETLLEFEHVGEYWLDDNNTRRYDGYTIAHLKASYQANKQLKLTAKVNNIADEVYAENANFSFGREKYTPGAPRQLFAGLDYRF
jgi:outer membrane receptor protein involved in Fe transport